METEGGVQSCRGPAWGRQCRGRQGGPLKPKDASHSAQGQENTASKDSFSIRGVPGRLGRLEVTAAREGFPETLG